MMYYTIYLHDTDEIVASGTAKECAKQMHTTSGCFHSIVSKSCRGIRKKYDVLKEKNRSEVISRI